MATDFFQRQDAARTNTSWLVFLFVVAVLSMVLTAAGLTAFGLQFYSGAEEGTPGLPPAYRWLLPIAAGALVLVVILLGSLFKVVILRSSGGTGVAEHLGGHRLYPNASDVHEKRALNVVEEMALASGMPVPPVFLLDEDGINAFAAGYTADDAVIGVTRGAIEKLTREQLQGVIAHEFSHILNGDMRINIRLIGILHGILLLGLIGHVLLRTFFYSSIGSSRRSRSSKEGGGGGGVILAILAAAIALIVIGFLGHFLGGLIKAAVSRQREFLADASAVQFTRNPSGIGGALKQIGARVRGSRLQHPSAPEASHLFFAKGVAEGFTRAMATHPPLPERILAIEPNWDGVFPEVSDRETSRSSFAAASAFAGSDHVPGESPRAAAETRAALATQARESIGAPENQHREYMSRLVAAIDPEVVDAAHEPFGAQAVVFALLIDTDEAVRRQQFADLEEQAPRGVLAMTKRLLPRVEAVAPETRLPLLDITVPALRSFSPTQYQAFDRCFQRLTAADRKMNLFEWTLSQILGRQLASQFGKVAAPRIRYYGLQRLGESCSVLLSTLAYAGHDERTAARALTLAASLLEDVPVQQLPQARCGLGDLHRALEQLREVAPNKRGLLVDACAASICADGKITVREGELLRGIAALLDCPMPPLLAGQPIANGPLTAGSSTS